MLLFWGTVHFGSVSFTVGLDLKCLFQPSDFMTSVKQEFPSIVL